MCNCGGCTYCLMKKRAEKAELEVVQLKTQIDRMRHNAGKALYADENLGAGLMNMVAALKDIELGCPEE